MHICRFYNKVQDHFRLCLFIVKWADGWTTALKCLSLILFDPCVSTSVKPFSKLWRRSPGGKGLTSFDWSLGFVLDMVSHLIFLYIASVINPLLNGKQVPKSYRTCFRKYTWYCLRYPHPTALLNFLAGDLKDSPQVRDRYWMAHWIKKR